MAEHRAYLPSIGLFIAFACGLDFLRTRCARNRDLKPWLQWSAPALLGLWVAALALGTVQRNQVWRTAITLWEDTVRKSPRKARPWFNLGAAYDAKEQWEKSLDAYRTVLELDPDYVSAYNNIAARHLELKQPREAIEIASQGVAKPLTAHHFALYRNLGLAYVRLGELDHALACFKRAVSLAPVHKPSRYGLATVYEMLGNYPKAVEHARIAAQTPPDDPGLWRDLKKLEAFAAERQADSTAAKAMKD
jgi:tetratricopeptide (TPR) repeat protein